MIDINYLKENAKRIYYFGLGFIQIVINDHERYHFYSDELVELAIDEGWHNHRYNFTSKVLKGELHQHKGIIIPGNTHILYNVNCGNKKELPYKHEIEIGFVRNHNDWFFEDSEYSIAFNEFHKVKTFGNTITHLKRSDYVTEFAQAIRPKDVEFVCPFSVSFTDEELWAKVEEIINE